MFCVKCGTQVPDGASFCPKCGTPAAQQAASELVPGSAPMTQELPPPPDGSGSGMSQPHGMPEPSPSGASVAPPASKPPASKLSGCIGGVIIIGLLALGFTCVHSCSSKSDSSVTTSSTATPHDDAEPGKSQELVQKAGDLLVNNQEIEGIKLLKIAADQGNINAQALLGGCLANGVGGHKDRKEAIRLLSLCVSRGEGATGSTTDDIQIRMVASTAKERLAKMGVK